MFDWIKLSDELDEVLFDHAASTPPLPIVKKVAQDFIDNYGSIHRGNSQRSFRSSEKYEAARASIANLFQRSPEEVVFTANTTTAINLLASLLPPPLNIAVTRGEHSANLLPWINFRHRLFFLPWLESADIDPEELRQFLRNHKIALLSVAAASNLSGRHLKDIGKVHAVCVQEETLFMLDACQYVPHYGSHQLSADIIAFSGHRAYAPYGAGALIAPVRVLRGNPLGTYTGGGNVTYIDEHLHSSYKMPPWNHEIGTPNGLGAVTMAAGLEFINQHRLEIAVYETDMTRSMADLRERLQVQGMVAVGAEDGPVLAIGGDKERVLKLEEWLQDHKIAYRAGNFCVYEALRHYLGTDNPEEVYMVRLSGGLFTHLERAVNILNQLGDFVQKL